MLTVVKRPESMDTSDVEMDSGFVHRATDNYLILELGLVREDR
jgi:hypothetical protein